jgi:type II secretory pathway pseudopilin PulG
VVVAILGVLAATAIPLMSVYRQRAMGSEAQVMLKQILEAEIMYYLHHNRFFPDNDTYTITHAGAEDPASAQDEIMDNLNLHIPTGHNLDYSITGFNPLDGEDLSIVSISSVENLPLFANGQPSITGTVTKDGEIDIW